MRCLVKVRTTNIRLDVRSNMFRSKRLLLAVIGLTAACLVAAYIRRPAQMAVVNETYDAWELDGSFGFPVRVAWNRLEPPGPPGLNFRDIFLFIEPEDFTERNLTAIFTGLDRRYPEPGTLLILVLTSREHLQRQIVSLQTPAPMDNVDHSLEPESEGIMLTSGFYRAYYERRNGGCRYSYSPDPHTKELRTVVLREKQIPYSGDEGSDIVLAASEGDRPTLERLLKAGANVNYRNSEGDTALCEAIRGGYTDCVRALLAGQTDVNARCRGGDTPLVVAAGGGDEDVVNTLLKLGARTNSRNQDGDSPLIRASYYSHPKVISILVAHGAEVDVKNHNGRTALMTAAGSGSAESVAVLVEAGANVWLTDRVGQTAAQLARGTERSRIMEILSRAASVFSRHPR
jgi:hypothetical protein